MTHSFLQSLFLKNARRCGIGIFVILSASVVGYVWHVEHQLRQSQDSPILYGYKRMGRARIEKKFIIDFRNAHFRPELELKVAQSYIEKLGVIGMLHLVEKEFPLCHNEAHALGRLLFKKVKNVATAVSICQNQCASGCIHGIVAASINDNDEARHISMQDFVVQMVKECSQSYAESHCVHGAGHALISMPIATIDSALSACASFSDERLEYRCDMGVFMEHEALHEDMMNDTLDYPCDIFTKYPAACYRYRVWRWRTTRTLQQMVDQCSKLQERSRIGCFHGIGHAYFGDVANSKLRLSDICIFGNLHDQMMCIDGAIGSLSDYQHRDAAYKACGVIQDATLLAHCYRAVQYGIVSGMETFFDLYPKDTVRVK